MTSQPLHTRNVLVGWLLYLPIAAGLLQWGTVDLKGGHSLLLAKFCFDYDPSGEHTGIVNFTLTSVPLPQTGSFRLVLLDDEADSYPNDHAKTELICDSVETNKKKRSEALFHAPFVTDSADGTRALQAYVTRIRERRRPRWWFVALVDCSGVDREISYQLHMTNRLQGYTQELSMDRCGLKTMGMCVLLFGALAVVQFRTIYSKTAVNAFHPLRVLLTAGIATAFLGIVLKWMEVVRIVITGEDLCGVYMAGQFLNAISKFLLYSMLMLLSRGSCISHPLNTEDLMYTGTVIAPFLFLCLCLECWGHLATAHLYSTRWVYTTSVGSVLVAMNLVLLVIYTLNLRGTLRRETDELKQCFYIRWGTVYTLAFLALPIFTAASYIIAPHVQSMVLTILSHVTYGTLFTLFVIGLRPAQTAPEFCIDAAKELSTPIGASSGDFPASLSVKVLDLEEPDMLHSKFLGA